MKSSKNMKLFVKQDGGFRYLGEGTIYDKKDLQLVNEVDAAMSGTKNNVTQGAQEASKTMAKTPSVNGVNATQEQLDGNPSDNGNTINVDVRSPQSQQTAQKMLDATGNDPKTTIHYFDGSKPQNKQQQQLNNSKVYTKRLIEMRRNSTPFTKKELDRYLKTF